jgi:hypothetical protein
MRLFPAALIRPAGSVAVLLNLDINGFKVEISAGEDAETEGCHGSA